jgi:tetraacyldisaccharide 4'-kinase
LKQLLAPLSFLYGALTSVRNTLFDYRILPVHTVALPVISVGNLTAGGNAKTPLVIELIKFLRAAGWHPAVISRGYGRKSNETQFVTPESDPALVGDEPLLIARETKAVVVVACRRIDGAKRIVEQALADCIILDDGFQHRSLHRDRDIVSIDVSSAAVVQAFFNQKLLPEGRFREWLQPALKRISAIVLAERGGDLSSTDADRLRALFPATIPILRSQVKIRAVASLNDGTVLKPGRIIALSAIANPAGFHSALTKAGYHIEEACTYPDHHQCTEAELRTIVTRHPHLPIVCTAKDSVKMQHFDKTIPLFVCITETELQPLDDLKKLFEGLRR